MDTINNVYTSDMAEDGELIARAQASGRSLAEQATLETAKEIIGDIFPDDDLKIEKLRDDVARKQTALDQLEAAVRAKADAYLRSIARRDKLAKQVERSHEQLKTAEHDIEFQLAHVQNGIGNVEPSDFSGDSHRLNQLSQALLGTRALVPMIQQGIDRLEKELAEASAEVAAFEKGAKA